jgi:hypothetical protein
MNAPELLDVIEHEETNDGDAGASDTNGGARRGVGVWAILLIVVIVFGYLTASRRKALGTLIEQIADIIRDFRGYDPEF